MFFEDPPAAFANLRGISAPGAAMIFSCFRERGDNPFFTEIDRLLPGAPSEPDPAAPGPFAFSDPHQVEDILARGGWQGIQFERFDFPMIAGADAEPVEDALTYFTRIGPAAAAAREMNEGDRQRFLGKLRNLCERHCEDGVVSLSASAWIVTARRD
jgi:hypothetical protein